MKRVSFYLMPIFFILEFNSIEIEYDSFVVKSKYKMDIPSNFFNHGVIRGGIETEDIYFYKDSSCIYITDNVTPHFNLQNIKTLGDSISNFRFQHNSLIEELNDFLGREYYKVWPDTLELSGKDGDSLYWKDIKIGDISVGYLKVSEKKKKIFDKSLRTLRKIE
jgi:hypothetical protein